MRGRTFLSFSWDALTWGALKIYTCLDLVLQGLTHINPQKAHIILTKCDGANINNITISAPEDAPNTDGIDIGGSNHVQVQNSKIGTGDDCIAISARWCQKHMCEVVILQETTLLELGSRHGWWEGREK
ncbi:putative polygalacturonase [Vitis vinifera]|uniref:Putative polygalacturonase n=1 Tax=Vitis vinifera TaxID=29760 RepID=A0A438G9X9_VITVI|nr:putative polygalacturonase [Vitis vinifera]